MHHGHHLYGLFQLICLSFSEIWPDVFDHQASVIILPLIVAELVKLLNWSLSRYGLGFKV